MRKESTGRKMVHGACPHDCPDTCAMEFHVEGDRLVEVTGRKGHPFTRGGLCVKLKDFADHHYNPDRVLSPLRRTGPKGSGAFTRITWDEAFHEIKTRWTAIIDLYGPQAILPYSYLGHEGLINGMTAGDAFFNKLGATVSEKTFCGSGSSTGYLMTMGPTGGMDPESFAASKYIIIWACNTMSTNLHHWPFVAEAQAKGAKVVVIDPQRIRAAKKADWHLQPRPGTDGALILGMMRVMIDENLIDRDYIAKGSVGFDDMKQRVMEWTVEKASIISGVAADDIRKLAREYAAAKGAAIRIGVGLERNAGGGDTVRMACMLPVMTGQWRYPGGGILQFPVWDFAVKWDNVCRPDFIPKDTRVINQLKLGAALNNELEEKLDPPIMSLFVYNANPVSQAPEQNKIVRGLMREDLFTVVSELFITDTASYADIVLPASMAAEMMDLMWSWGHHYLTMNLQAIEPRGESLPNYVLFQKLARLMGFTDRQFAMPAEEMIKDFIDWDSPVMKGITYDLLHDKGYAHLTIGDPMTRTPHAEGKFPTPSGKFEFKSAAASGGNFIAPPFRQGYNEMQPGEPVDAVPKFIAPNESPVSNAKLAKRYPLNIISPKSHGFLNSCYANEPHKIRGQGEQFILIHPADAVARNITDGAPVRVFNERGAFEGDALITEDVLQGCVVSTLGYWSSLSRSGNTVNSVSSDKFCNLGHSPTYSDNLVEVSLTNRGPSKTSGVVKAELERV
ncbi:MAG: molybdopterin oxidoreductase family protein [Alphaproteobacteria bacterium]